MQMYRLACVHEYIHMYVCMSSRAYMYISIFHAVLPSLFEIWVVCSGSSQIASSIENDCICLAAAAAAPELCRQMWSKTCR